MKRDTLLPALLCLLIAGPAAAEKVDLRGPAPKAGDVFLLTTDMNEDETNQPMQFELGDPENPDDPRTPEVEEEVQKHEISFAQSMRQQVTLQVQILEVADGEPTKVQTRFLDYSRVSEQSVVGLPNADPTRSEDTSWEDCVVTATKTRSGWKTDTQGAGKKVSDLYLIGNGFTDPRLAYPAEPVGVGETWEIAYEKLPFLFRHQKIDWPMGGSATVKFKLAEVKQTDQGPVAVIEYTYEKKDEEDDPGKDGDFRQVSTQKGAGRIERNLTTYLDTVAFASMTEIQTDLTPGDVKVKMMTKKIIPVTIESSQSRGDRPAP